MEGSQSSGSDVNSVIQSFGQNTTGRRCHCSRPTKILKSWTDENPGRRFFKCEVHGFSTWADVEKQNEWQKASLLEARDQIRQQKEEIKGLTKLVKEVNQQMSYEPATETNMENSGLLKKIENEVMASKEREKLLKQFIAISWGGFIVVTAMILTMGKK